MRTPRFSDSQILATLKQNENCAAVQDLRALISITTTNKNRIWQDTWSDDVHPRKIAPQDIALKTKFMRTEYNWIFIDFVK
jgi:hypothetical protein